MIPWYEIKNTDDVPSPAVLIYPDRIEENLQRMISLVGDVTRLRPHVKTHKLPQIIAMKRSLGIEKFKASTIAEAEMTASAGGRDILLAYQPVGPHVTRLIKLIKEFPESHFSALVDNLQSLRRIADAAQQANIRVELYMDLNVGMDRTGITPGPSATELYKAMATTAPICPGGLHAYDGHLHEPDQTILTAQVEQTFAPVWRLRDQLIDAGYPVPKVVAAGTPTSKLLAQQQAVEVGAGTTVLWDFGQAEISPDLEFLNAAVLLARVISRPTPDRLCIDLGHKAVASEMAPPRVRFFGLEDATPVMHSEEHLVLQTPLAAHYPVGSVLYGIPRHICPTVALHHEVWCVRDQRAIETWAVVARDRRISI